MSLHTRSRNHKLTKWLLLIALEGWPILVLLSALAIEFRHITDSNWLPLFLYNGDSLTLPILRQTLAHKDPFLWVSSSQFLIFPEGIFYTISSILTKSIRASLAFNGALNVVSLYILLRWCAGILTKTTRYFQQLFALGCCLLLIFYMILERQALINFSSIATLFMFTAYYYGVIISGAALLCIILNQAKTLPALSGLSKRQIGLACASFLVALLTSFSDPIFIIQFTIPFLIVLAFMFLYNGFRLKDSFFLGLPLLVGSALGYITRIPLKDFLGESLNNHVSTLLIPGTLTVFHDSISHDLHTTSGSLELLLVFAVIIFSAVYSTWWIYQKTHYKDRDLDARLLLLSLFAVIEPTFIILFSIVTGSMVTRYLLPLVIFPMFGLLPLISNKLLERLRRIVIPTSIVFFLIIFVLGLSSIGKAARFLSSSSYADSRCLASALHNQAALGVGDYWTVRALDVYGQSDEQALQVNAGLSVYPWQSNLGSYYDKKFSFVVVDKPGSASSGYIYPTNSYIPAHPSQIYTCSDLYIYSYAPGTTGYNQLNNDIATSYNNLVKIRAAGKLPQLYFYEPTTKITN